MRTNTIAFVEFPVAVCACACGWTGAESETSALRNVGRSYEAVLFGVKLNLASCPICYDPVVPVPGGAS